MSTGYRERESGVPCRICQFAEPNVSGTVEYLAGYSWKVIDCQRCGCRSTAHDSKVHELLHSTGIISYYEDYRRLMERCQKWFVRGDIQNLRAVLDETSKYRFILSAIDRTPAAALILEVGCSRGYLTSYAILSGRNIVGIDVAVEAIAAARKAFGQHFEVAGSKVVQSGPVHDLIYHVGMIGCVKDPVQLTRDLLALLKPGGRLLFNAPNRDACHLKGQLWLDTAPPPDVVTLFPQGFWQKHVSDLAEVRETVETLPPTESLRVAYRQRFGRAWKPPVPIPLEGDGTRGRSWSQSPTGLASFTERATLKAARALGLERFCKPRPTDFGLFVELTRRPLS